MIAPEDGSLHIDRITVEDQGLYTCQATNLRGSAESSAYVWVTGEFLSAQASVPLIGPCLRLLTDSALPYMAASECPLFSGSVNRRIVWTYRRIVAALHVVFMDVVFLPGGVYKWQVIRLFINFCINTDQRRA